MLDLNLNAFVLTLLPSRMKIAARVLSLLDHFSRRPHWLITVLDFSGSNERFPSWTVYIFIEGLLELQLTLAQHEFFLDGG